VIVKKRLIAMSKHQHFWPVLDRVAIVLMVVASLTVIWRSASARVPAATNVAVQDVEETVPGALAQKAATKGMATALVAIVEFSDYECPFCGRNATDVYPQLQRDFVDTGKARYFFLNFPLEALHPQAFRAAEAAECAGAQGRYWEMHDLLFKNQKAFTDASLLRYASQLGLRVEPFEACLEGEVAAKIREHQAFGRSLQVTSTPVFFIGEIQTNGGLSLRRRLTGAQPYSSFRSILTDDLSPSLWRALRSYISRS
jgi:protein-disulfide isomerase